MTMTTGYLTVCSEKNIVGGVAKFFLANCSEWEGGTFVLTADEYSALTPSATETFFLFDTMEERTSYTSSSEGKGKGTLITYEKKFFIPGHATAAIAAAESMKQAGKILLVTEDWDGGQRLFGYDELYGLKAAGEITSIVDSSGETSSDMETAGVEVTMSFVHKEIARNHVGTVPV